MRKEYVLTEYEYNDILNIINKNISDLFKIKRDDTVEKTLNDLCYIREVLYNE